jgi:hypothetical protein
LISPLSRADDRAVSGNQPLQNIDRIPSRIAFTGTFILPHWWVGIGNVGTVRATQDVDVLMLLDGDTRRNLLSILASHGFVVDTRWAQANPMLDGILTRLRHGFCPVDLFQPRDAHERETLARRRLVQLEKTSVWWQAPRTSSFSK